MVSPDARPSPTQLTSIDSSSMVASASVVDAMSFTMHRPCTPIRTPFGQLFVKCARAQGPCRDALTVLAPQGRRHGPDPTGARRGLGRTPPLPLAVKTTKRGIDTEINCAIFSTPLTVCHSLPLSHTATHTPADRTRIDEHSPPRRLLTGPNWWDRCHGPASPRRQNGRRNSR